MSFVETREGRDRADTLPAASPKGTCISVVMLGTMSETRATAETETTSNTGSQSQTQDQLEEQEQIQKMKHCIDRYIHYLQDWRLCVISQSRLQRC